jgi:hypothetical protein
MSSVLVLKMNPPADSAVSVGAANALASALKRPKPAAKIVDSAAHKKGNGDGLRFAKSVMRSMRY